MAGLNPISNKEYFFFYILKYLYEIDDFELILDILLDISQRKVKPLIIAISISVVLHE